MSKGLTGSLLVGLICLSSFVAAQKLLDKNKVVYALNCGSDQTVQSEHGFEYGPDRYYKNGVPTTHPENHGNILPEGIKYTKDKKLHLSERFCRDEWLDYELPIPGDGDYVLILQFTDLNLMYPGLRVFHIYFGDSVVRPNFDIIKGGRQSQVSLYLPFSLRLGEIQYANYLDCEKAYNSNTKTLRLRFKKYIENPKIDGIVLFKGKIEETNFFSLDENRKEWDSRVISNKGKEQLRDLMMEDYMKKKRMKKVARNDHDEHEEFEKDFIEINEEGGGKGKLIGLVILIALVGVCYYGSQRHSKKYSEVDQTEATTDKRSSKRKAREETTEETSKKNVEKKNAHKHEEEEEENRQRVNQRLLAEQEKAKKEATAKQHTKARAQSPDSDEDEVVTDHKKDQGKKKNKKK